MSTPATVIKLVDRDFGNWLAGFIDGEGYFGLHKHKRYRKDRSVYYCWGCRFTLKLRADDEAILRECQERTGLGTIRYEQPKQGKLQAFWTIEDRYGCQELVKILDRHPLRAKKQRDYEIWREAVAIWTNRAWGNRWTGEADWTEMETLRAELDELR